MVRYNGLVWSNIAVLQLFPSYIDDPWILLTIIKERENIAAVMNRAGENKQPAFLCVTPRPADEHCKPVSAPTFAQ